MCLFYEKLTHFKIYLRVVRKIINNFQTSRFSTLLSSFSNGLGVRVGRGGVGQPGSHGSLPELARCWSGHIMWII